MISEREGICLYCCMEVFVVPPPWVTRHKACGKHVTAREVIAGIPSVSVWWRFKRWARGRLKWGNGC